MAHYSLFFPGCTTRDGSAFAETGLDLSPVGWSWIDAQGPDGSVGLLAARLKGDPENDPLMDVVPQKQHWEPVEEDTSRKLSKGRYWIGWEKERPPQPADLVLEDPQGGNKVLVNDEYSWVIPAYNQVRQRFILGPDGNVKYRYDAQFERYCLRCERFMHDIFESLDLLDYVNDRVTEETLTDDVTAMTVQGGWEHCCEALMINYRVTPEIISALGLLTSESMRDILINCIDMPQIIAARSQKKTDDSPEGATSSTPQSHVVIHVT